MGCPYLCIVINTNNGTIPNTRRPFQSKPWIDIFRIGMLRLYKLILQIWSTILHSIFIIFYSQKPIYLMKTVFVFTLLVCLSGTAFAQINFNVQAIQPEEVPEAVKTAQSGYFPGLAVNLWEKQTASGAEQSGSRYVASFKDGSNQTIRARYLNDGTGVSATTYYLSGTKLPSVIQSAATQDYPNYTLRSGEKLQLLATGKIVFRLRLRKGAQKLVVYVDSNGDEVSKNQIPTEVQEEEHIE